MFFHVKMLILVRVIMCLPRMNLFFTEIIDEQTVIQHNCLGIIPYYAEIRGYFEIVSYCLSELPSEFIIDERYLISKYTFSELAHQNITT